MDDVISEAANPHDLIDFIVTGGDNIYPLSAHNPTDKEFDDILAMFQTPHLKDLKVYAVRGNHDCEFAWDREI